MMQAGGKPARRSLRALVAGAGPAGLATALALRDCGIDAVVLERADSLARRGTGLTLWPNAVAALRAIGAADSVLAVSEPCDGIEIRSHRGELLDATPGDVMRRKFGHCGIALSRADLIDVLVSTLGRQHVRCAARCVDYRDDGKSVTVVLEGGEEMHGDVLVGADGMRSLIRAQMVGYGDDLRYAGYVVYRAIAEHDLHGKPGILTMGRGAQFGMFPMPRGRAYWFASREAPASARQLAANTKYCLLESFASWHEPIPGLVAATDTDALVSSAIYDREPLQTWSKGRVTLVGDAAHPSTPNLGQGTCQAFEDAVILARSLRDCDNVAVALQTYEAHRRQRANTISVQARRFGQIGRWSNPAACWLRNQMIKRLARRNREKQLHAMFAFDQQ